MTSKNQKLEDLRVDDVYNLLLKNRLSVEVAGKFKEEEIDGYTIMIMRRMPKELLPMYSDEVKFENMVYSLTGRFLTNSQTTKLNESKPEHRTKESLVEETNNPEPSVKESSSASDSLNETTIIDDSDTETEITSTDNAQDSLEIRYPAPLPTFTKEIEIQLNKKEAFKVIDAAVAQIAYYYIYSNYKVNKSCHYSLICSTFLDKYHLLYNSINDYIVEQRLNGKMGLTSPLSFVRCKLSKKMRNIRQSMKKKHQTQ